MVWLWSTHPLAYSIMKNSGTECQPVGTEYDREVI